MTKALDRVKAAEAKYEAMAATAEKVEATLKELRLRNRFSVIGLGTRFLRRTPIGQVQILPAG